MPARWRTDSTHDALIVAQGRADALRDAGARTHIEAVLDGRAARWRVDVWVDADGRVFRPERVVHPDDAPRLPWVATDSLDVH